jgi:cellulose synthase/poly-beta-1,6-N-acetylglucosamine synthase-like glycosyltransferase
VLYEANLTLLILLFETYRLLLRVLVLVMSAQFVAATIQYLRQRRQASVPPPPAEWPRVTVQLPLRNEYYTAARVIGAAAALDYPSDRLEVQVLDDSDDETVSVVADAVRRARAKGIDAIQIRRDSPEGYKAGALAHGLKQAKGELVAVFDADFVPNPSFLKHLVPYFGDPKVGLVQGRWEHKNRTESWFTRLQAQILDGLMVVEQTAKSFSRVPFQFNGTAGVWRREAIESSGGWTFDSLTEDFDLSLRAQLRGYRLVHLPEISVPSELPPTLGLFRVQQRRWALGTAQLLRKRFLDVLRADVSVSARLALMFQLLRHFGYPLLVIMVLTVPLTTFNYVHTPLDYGPLNAIILAIAMASVAFQQLVAERALGKNPFIAVALAPLSIALAIGLAPTYAVALVYGLTDHAGAFERTPKVPGIARAGEPHYRAQRSALVAVELLVGALYASLAVYGIMRQFYPESAFLAFVAASYLWVGFGSLHVNAGSAPEAVPVFASETEARPSSVSDP